MKLSLSCSEQVELLRLRGLEVSGAGECVKFLAATNYYRLSGYARYFQKDPQVSDGIFRPGSSFADIREIYHADEHLRGELLTTLGRVEILLRSHFARVVADKYGPYGDFLKKEFYQVARSGRQAHQSCLQDIRRSQERHILRYQTTNPGEAEYGRLPVWSAVELWSFGTLSRAIERGARGDLARVVADSIAVTQKSFASRLKALVYLRNRCAHHSKLWHHSMIDAGRTPHNVRHRAKLVAGHFEPRSVIDAIASLDDLASRSGVGESLLPQLVERGRENAGWWRGLTHPHSP